MEMILVVAFLVGAVFYLVQSKINVSNPVNMVINFTYSLIEESNRITANDEFIKEINANILIDYCEYKLVFVGVNRLKVSLRIAIGIHNEDYL